MREFLLATVATQLAVLPLLLYHMGQFSVIALVANVLVLPIVPVAMLLTFLTGVVALVAAPLSIPLSYGAYLVLMYIIGLATQLAALPYAMIEISTFPGWMIPLMYASIAALGYWRSRHDTLPASTVSNHDTKQQLSQVAKWTVVEELDVPTTNSIQTAKEPATVADSSETPIFFR
jgi:predicted membrane metal-binding protein